MRCKDTKKQANSKRKQAFLLLLRREQAQPKVKKSRLARLQVGTSTYAVNQCPLRDLDGLGDLLLRLGLRHRDGQDAVLYLGRNLVANHIVRQHVVLLIVRVTELAAQVVTVTVLMLVFLFVLNGDGEVTLVVDGYAAIFYSMR